MKADARRDRTESDGSANAGDGAASGSPPPGALKLFISYSRADIAHVDPLVEALQQSGFDVRIDRNDLPYIEEWQKELSYLISEADTVVWLVSPDSVKSRWCNWELGEVVRLSKRLAPVVIRPVDHNDLPEALGRIQLLPSQGVYRADLHKAVLVDALNTDAAWLKIHTALAADAGAWIASGRDKGHLLRGSPLTEAEAWSTRRPPAAPAPTPETLQMLLASRAAQRRRQRYTLIGSVAATIVAIGLAAAALVFQQQAVEQAAEADRQRAAAEAANTQSEVEKQKAIEAAAAAEAESRRAEAERQNAEAAKQRAEQEARRAEEQRQVAETQRRSAQAAESHAAVLTAQTLMPSRPAPSRPDVSMAIGLNVAPASAKDDQPLSAELVSMIRHAYDQTSIPTGRKLVDNVFNVVSSPDGKTIAAGTAGSDDTKGTVYLFDAATMHERSHFKAIDDVVSGLSFSADGTRLAVAGGEVPTVWDVASGSKLFDLVIPNPKGFSKLALFSPDGTFIVVGTSANEALIFDAEGRLKHVLPGMEFDDMLKRLQTASGSQFGVADGIVEAVSRSTWKIWGTATDVAISPDSSLVAVTGAANLDGAVQIFDARTGKLVELLTGGAGSLFGTVMGYGHTVQFSPDGKSVIASPTALTIKIWNVDDGKLRIELPARGISTFLVSGEGRALISGHSNGLVTFRCLEGLLETVTIQAHADAVLSIVEDEAGGLLATSSSDGSAKIWPLPSEDEICEPITSTGESVAKLAFLQPRKVFAGHGGVVHKVQFNRTDRSVLTAGQDGLLRSWPLESDSGPFASVEWSGAYPNDADASVLATSDGRQVFVRDSAQDGFVVFDTRNGLLPAPPINIAGVALRGSDGVPVLFSSPLQYWRFGEAPPLGGGVENSGWLGVVSPDASRVVREKVDEATFQSSLFVTDVKSGKDIVRLQVDGRSVAEARFSGDGTRLFGRLPATDDSEGDGLAAWDAGTGALLGYAKTIPEYSQATHFQAPADGQRILLFDAGYAPRLFAVTNSGLEQVNPKLTAEELGKAPATTAVAFSNDGRIMATGRQDGSIAITDAATGAVKVVTPSNAPVGLLAVSPMGSYIAALDDRSQLSVISVETGEFSLRTLQFEPVVIRLLGDTPRVFTLDSQGELSVLTGLMPESLSFVDWLRARRVSDLGQTDTKKFGIRVRTREPRPDLDEIKPLPVPPERSNPAPNADAAECDLRAAYPDDRDRRADGVKFDALDAETARPPCERAHQSFPEDLQTAYQLGRIYDRLGQVDAAFASYLDCANRGYAVAMRRVSEMIDGDIRRKFAQAGSPQEWLKRAAQAGDPWSLADMAINSALDTSSDLGIERALAVLAAEGIDNRAEAAMNLAVWISGRGDSPELAQRAFFFATLGFELDESVADAPQFQATGLRWDTRELIRELERKLEPAKLVSEYQLAKDWRAKGSPY